MWTLIVLAICVGYNAVALTSVQGFQTKAACMAAGGKAASELRTTTSDIRTVCVEVTLP